MWTVSWKWGSGSSSKTKFTDFSSQSHKIPWPILPHISVMKAHNNLQHHHKLSRQEDFTISNDSVPGFVTFFSSTHFRYCLKFGKISIIFYNYWHIFYPATCNSLLIPHFPANFAFFPTSNRFSHPVGLDPVKRCHCTKDETFYSFLTQWPAFLCAISYISTM